MSITHVANGANIGSGSSPVSCAVPAGVAVGDLLVIHSVVRESAPTTTVNTPSGFSVTGSVQGGAGAEGADSGKSRTAPFIREADGSEGASVSVSTTGATLSSLNARMSAYRKASGDVWDVAYALATINSGGSTSLSFVFDRDPDIRAGDLVLCCLGMNTDDYTYSGYSLTASGITEGTVTQRYSNGNTAGNDLHSVLVTHDIASGVSAGVPTLSLTASGSVANAPAGSAVLLRLRAVTPGGGGGTIAPISSGYHLRGFNR